MPGDTQPITVMPSRTTPASSSGSPRPRAAATGKRTVATASNHRHWPQSDKSPPGTGGTLLPGDRGTRTSVNVYGSDLDRLESLRVYLRKQTGLRVIKDSSLLQVLCRTCKPLPEHVDALRAVLAQSGRNYRT